MSPSAPVGAATRGADSGAPERLALLPLLATILLLPPEVHGLTLAGASGLILLAAAVTWWRGPARGRLRGWSTIAWAVALLFPFVLIAPAPAVAAAPLAIFVLAAAAALAGAAAHDAGRAVAITVAGTATAVALYGLWQRAFGLRALASRLATDPALPDRADLLDRVETGRAFGTLSTPAALGGLLALALPIAVGLALGASGRRRVVWSAMAAVQCAGLLATVSATAALALGLAAAAASLGGFSARDRRLRVGFAVAAVAIAALLAGIVAIRGPGILDATDPDSPLRLRAGNFRSAYAMAADHPWLGVGPGAFAEFYPAYRLEGDNETRHVHNLPLELMAETGFVTGGVIAVAFLAAFVWPLAYGMVQRSRESPRSSAAPPWSRGVAVGLAAFAIHNLGDYTAWMPSLLWTAAILLGVEVGRRTGRVGRPELPAAHRFRAGPLAGFATVAAAAAVALASGIARDARFDARLAAWTGDVARAEQLAATAAAWAPWDADAALFLARATLGADERRLTDPQRRLALERAEHAVRLVPVRAAARRVRARARLATGDAPGAYADLAAAARLYPLHEAYGRERDGVAARLIEFSESAAGGRVPDPGRP